MVNIAKDKVQEIFQIIEGLISRSIQGSLDRPWDFPKDDIPNLEELREQIKEYRKIYLKE